MRFLNDLQMYIQSYICVPVPSVLDFNQFNQAMFDYGENNNPIGFELYQKQVDYIIKKASGYNFKL